MADLTIQHTSSTGTIFSEKWKDNGDGTYTATGDKTGGSYLTEQMTASNGTIFLVKYTRNSDGTYSR